MRSALRAARWFRRAARGAAPDPAPAPCMRSCSRTPTARVCSEHAAAARTRAKAPPASRAPHALLDPAKQMRAGAAPAPRAAEGATLAAAHRQPRVAHGHQRRDEKRLVPDLTGADDADALACGQAHARGGGRPGSWHARRRRPRAGTPVPGCAWRVRRTVEAVDMLLPTQLYEAAAAPCRVPARAARCRSGNAHLRRCFETHQSPP